MYSRAYRWIRLSIPLVLVLLIACDQRETSPQMQSQTQTQSQRDGSAAENPLPRYSASAFFETTSFAMPAPGPFAFSAVSGELLISSDETGVYNAWAVDTESGDRRPLTRSEGAPVFALSWFPDDDRVLFTQDGGGDELNHVFVKTESGDTVDLTPGSALKAGLLNWLSDGSAFYLFSNERDAAAFDVYRYSPEDYSRSLVYENSDGFNLAALSDDGRWLALLKQLSNRNSNLYLVDLQAPTGEPRLITGHKGDVSHGAYSFTPDSQRLIYETDAHGEFAQAWSYDLATRTHTPLIEADWDLMYVSYSPSGRYRVSGVNRDARTAVSIMDLEREQALDLPELPQGDILGVRFSRDEQTLAFLLNGDTSPPDVFAVSLLETTAERLTNALNPAIDADQLVAGEVVRFASYDGLEVPGILYRPREASTEAPVPALVWVHGGPGGQSRKGYIASVQHLVNHGYAVYRINNRGSSGYGKTFFHLDDQKHGEADLGDVVASRAYLAELDWIDGDRIGIYGGSYGGYMVAAALAFEPEVFDVGVNVFGVTNWVRTLESIPAWWGPNRKALYDELGDPATDRERLRRISPLFHAGNIRKPLLVVQGANDPRVLQVESDELVEAVRANDVPVEYLLFDDEGHGFRKRDNKIAASEAYVDFLNAHLRQGGD